MSDWSSNPGSTDMGRMMRGAPMRAYMARTARRVQMAYKAIAPHDSHELANSAVYRVETGGRRRDRVIGVVEVLAPYAAAVEFGNRRTGGRGTHALKRALRKV